MRRLVQILAASILVATGVSGPVAGAYPATDQQPTRIRHNVKDLTTQQRHDFVDAVLALKSVPSPYDPQFSYYDQFVAWHLALYPCSMGHEAMRAHGGPMFLPWHRLFVLRFEDALREVSGKDITVPYWDWTDPASTEAVFADDFMGGDGDSADGFAVKSGPFRKSAWTLRVQPIGAEWSPSATTYLTRRFASFPSVATLPTADDVAWALARPNYDVAPYDAGSNIELSFRNALEGFWRNMGPARVATGPQSMACGPDGVMTGTGGERLHNGVHIWVGGLLDVTPQGPKLGTMFLPTSPNDPVFFLHHANVDRLWAAWQDAHGVQTYAPADCSADLVSVGCASNEASDHMHPPFDATPASVADIGSLGYAYDSASPAGGTASNAGPATWNNAERSLRLKCVVRKGPA